MPTTVLNQSAPLGGTDDGDSGNNNLNFRDIFGTAVLSAAVGNQVRLTLLFGTSCPSLTNAIDDFWFGQSGAADPNFTGDQIRITFGGGNNGCNSSAAGVVVSDWCTLAQNWDNTKKYTAAFHTNTTATNISMALSGVANIDVWNGGSTSNASSTTAPGFSQFTSNVWLVEKIEIQAAGDAVVTVGMPRGTLFGPSTGPTRGLRPTQAFPRNLNIPAGTGTYSLSGVVQGLGVGLPVTTGTYALTGNAQTLTLVPNPVGITPPTIFAPGRGPTRGLRLTQAFPFHAQVWTLTAGTGTYTLNGVAQTLNRGILVSPITGTYALSGVAQTLTANITLGAVGQTTPTIFGPDTYPTRGLIRPQAFPASGIPYTLAAAQGTYSLTGISQTTTSARSITAVQGTYTLTGVTQGLGVGMPATTGSYVLSGKPQSFAVALSLHPVTGTYTLNGRAQTLTLALAGAAQPGDSVGSSISGGYFSRGKWHKLLEEIAAEKAQAKAVKNAAQRKAIAPAATLAAKALRAAKEAEESAEVAADLRAMTNALQAAAGAKSLSIAIAHANEAKEFARSAMAGMVTYDDDEEAEAVELLWLL